MTPKNRRMLCGLREAARERRIDRDYLRAVRATTVRQLTRALLKLWTRHGMYSGPITERMDRKGLERVARVILEGS